MGAPQGARVSRAALADAYGWVLRQGNGLTVLEGGSFASARLGPSPGGPSPVRGWVLRQAMAGFFARFVL